MKRRVLGLGAPVLLLTLLVAGWWWTRMTPPVTEAEARAYLGRLVAAARAHDFDALCDLNGAPPNCHRTLDSDNLRAAVPPDPPTVTGTRYYPEQNGGVAGRMLVVEGRNACGRPYRTEVFVFRENRFGFKAVNAAYWSNYHFATGPDISPPGPPPAPCP